MEIVPNPGAGAEQCHRQQRSPPALQSCTPKHHCQFPLLLSVPGKGTASWAPLLTARFPEDPRGAHTAAPAPPWAAILRCWGAKQQEQPCRKERQGAPRALRPSHTLTIPAARSSNGKQRREDHRQSKRESGREKWESCLKRQAVWRWEQRAGGERGHAAAVWGHLGRSAAWDHSPQQGPSPGRAGQQWDGSNAPGEQEVQLPPVGGLPTQWNYFCSCNKEGSCGGGETGTNPKPDAVAVAGAPMRPESSNRGLCIALLLRTLEPPYQALSIPTAELQPEQGRAQSGAGAVMGSAAPGLRGASQRAAASRKEHSSQSCAIRAAGRKLHTTGAPWGGRPGPFRLCGREETESRKSCSDPVGILLSSSLWGTRQQLLFLT